MGRKGRKGPAHRGQLTPDRARSTTAFGRHGDQPTPLRALELKHRQTRKWLSARNDPFSRRLAQLVSTRRDSDRLVLSSRLSEKPHAELKTLASEAIPSLQGELRSLSDRIRSLLHEGDPTFLICWTSFWHTFGLEGTYFEPTHHGLEAAIEFTAGLAADVEAKDEMEPDVAAGQELLALLDESFEVAKLLLLAEAHQGDSRIQSELRYRSRLHSLLVRGDAYVDQGERLARDLYEPEADWMKRELGFDVADVIELEVSLTALLERRVSDLLTSIAEASMELRAILRARKAPATLRQTMAKVGKKRLIEHFFITSLADGIVDAMAFSPEDVVGESARLDSETVDRMLSTLAMNGDSHYWSPLQRSPLRPGPVVRAGDRFMAPVIGLLRRDLPETLQPFVLGRRPRFAARRAKVLDNLAVECLREALPGAQTFVSVYYPSEGEDGPIRAECDGLVLWNDVCFVVEGKGKALSPQSRRGDVKRIHADLEASLAAAWKQGNRVLAYLRRARPAVFCDDKGRELVCVDGPTLAYAKVVAPTVHALADYALNLEQFADMGLGVSGEPPWAIPNDLRMICELVRSPAELICYVRWRDRLHLGHSSIAGDEADVFGAFLLRAQYRESASGGTLQIGSHSTDLDSYFMSRETDSEIAKPGMFSIPLVDRFLERLSDERPDGWLDVADVVLTLSLEQLAFVDHAAPLLAEAAASGTGVVSHSEFGATVVAVPPSYSVRSEAQRGAAGPHVYVMTQRGATEVIWASSNQ